MNIMPVAKNMPAVILGKFIKMPDKGIEIIIANNSNKSKFSKCFILL